MKDGETPSLVSTPWELNLTLAFAKDAATAVKTIRLPVSFSAALTAGGAGLVSFGGRTGELFHG
jgi:hypothetical protein